MFFYRVMNPLLMTAVRNSTIQPNIIRDSDLQNSSTDSYGFPLSVIHDIKVVVETFRLLIRAEWKYSRDIQHSVHWSKERIDALSPSNESSGTTLQQQSPPL